MISRARVKVPEARFAVGDASSPALQAAAYDVVLSRHVLWALPDPLSSIIKWVDLLKSGGLLVLIERRWSTGGGLTAPVCGNRRT